MSQENALAFIARVNEDSSLQAKLRPLAANDVNGLLNIAAEAGFAFDAKDLLAAQSSKNAPENELAEADLNLIAGGGIGQGSPLQTVARGIFATSACPLYPR